MNTIHHYPASLSSIMSYPPASSSRQDCLLIVDDVADNRFLLASILQYEGYRLEFATDGPSALDVIKKSPPDLVLLDVMMPGMNGIEVTQAIRQDESLPFIPILLLTAHNEASVAQGLDSGADDFLRKPVEIDELMARVRALLRLKHSVDERNEIARQRSDFVSRLTHDLRTPLVAADRMLNLLEQGVLGDLTEDMHEAIVVMLRSNQNLLQMVNQLLEVYRYEAGRKNLQCKPIAMLPLLEEVMASLNPLAQVKGLTLTNAAAALPPAAAAVKVWGDRLELNRVFTNLIGNAIKFTDRGQVTISLEPTAIATTPPQCCVTIQDTGSGISVEDQQRLFDRFQTGRHQGAGSGLGLYLSQCIITAHHGQIMVASTVGAGSTFTVQLPIVAANEAAAVGPTENHNT